MSIIPVEAMRKQIVALIPVYMNVFMVGCALGWLPVAIYFLLAGDATTLECALIASFSEIGRIIFSIPAGILTDTYGRKKITISIALLHFFIWLAILLDTSLLTIYIGRLLLGVTISLLNATSLVSIGEMASAEIRGRLISLYQIFQFAGCLLPSIMGVIFSSYKSLSYGVTAFSIVSLLTMIWVSETPNFLISISNLEQANNTLHRIREGYQETEIDMEFEKMKKYIEDEKIRKNQASWLKFFKSKAIRKPLLTGILLNFFSVLTGAITTYAYITDVYPANDYVPKKYYPLMGQILGLLISITVPFFIEKFPRRNLFMADAAGMVITNSFCAFVGYFDDENHKNVIFNSVFVTSNVLMGICYVALVQPMNSTLKSELYPQAVKGFCGSLGVISQALGTALGYQLYSFCKNYFHLYLVYVTFSINSLILYLAVYFLLPESRGTLLADLQIKFQQQSSPRDSCSVEINEKI